MMPKLLEMSRDTNTELSRWALELRWQSGCYL